MTTLQERQITKYYLTNKSVEYLSDIVLKIKRELSLRNQSSKIKQSISLTFAN